jgi:hypothetical protein
VNDDGLVELLVRRAQLPAQRLASAPGTDEQPALSPDGRRLAFATTRWDTLHHTHIAVVSLADSSVTRVTDGDAVDARPVWAADGDRLAFGRDYPDDRPGELCVATLEPGAIACRPLPRRMAHPLGWMDDDRIIYLESAGSRARLRIMQWSTGDAFTLTELATSLEVNLSPDMQWAFCLCSTTAAGEIGPVVFPLAAPSLARKVSLPPDAPTPTRRHSGSRRVQAPRRHASPSTAA